jgi:hypothetical protein
MRRVHEQEGGSIRASGVPSAGDRQATKSGIVFVLWSAPWSARVKRKDRNSDVLCRRRVVRRQGGGSSRASGVPSAAIGRQPRAALSLSPGARHGARGLSGRIRTLTFSVVVASCGGRGGEAFVRPGSHPPAIGRQPRAALSLSSGARHGERGLSGRIGTLTFSVVVASCGGRGGGSIRAPGVPSAGDRQATKSCIVLVLRRASWSARVKWKDRNSYVLCRRRVVRRQGGGCIRAPGVPSAGDRQVTRSGIDLVLRSASWSVRVKRKDRNSDILCCRRVVRRVQEQEGGLVRTPGVPSAGDRRATKSGLDLILLSYTH